MTTTENYVKLIGKMDCRREAWKTSRPKFTEENLNFDKVAEMDLSLNSMMVYTFEVRSSAIFRDLIFSLRPLEGWALSTRSMPIDRTTIYLADEFSMCDFSINCINKFFSALENGASRDQARDLLPMSVSTVYTFTMDYRVLISFVKTLRELSPKLCYSYGMNLLIAAGISLKEFNKCSVREATEYYLIDDKEKINGIHETGNMIHGHYKMKLALASQFLRQHYSKIKIGLWNILEDYEKKGLTQADIIDVVFYIDSNSYRRLMSMRSHWVIDWSMDMWGGIVGDYTKDMNAVEFFEFIPNGNGKKDPYWADVYNRVIGEDPGLPCPIMCEWPEMIAKKREEIGDSPILDMYDGMVKYGLIKDNPNNEHRLKALQMRDDL